MEKNTCCIFGHRKIEITLELRKKLNDFIEKIIADKNINIFLFGSKSEFNDLCLEIISSLKEKYPHIKRVYVRAEYPYINENYKNYLLKSYDETYYPPELISAGKSVYIERNCYIIDKSSICIVYFSPNYTPPAKTSKKANLPNYQTKSGTEIAYKYAKKKGKNIINFFN